MQGAARVEPRTGPVAEPGPEQCGRGAQRAIAADELAAVTGM